VVDRRSKGLTVAELLVVVAILALVVTLAAVAWRNVRGKADVAATARIVKAAITRARMLAVYRAEDHFVVVDPAARTIAIYRDSQTPIGEFDAGDERVAFEPLPGAAGLLMPNRTGSLASPFGGQTLTEAWSLPVPEARGAWGGALRGFIVTAEGQLVSAAATPEPIVSGVMVFSDASGQAAAVGVRGQAGNARAFRWDGTAWSEL
jgi:hypothetical protein